MNPLIAFDADVLIYAAVPENALGAAVRSLFNSSDQSLVGIGSVLLLPEVLSKPMRQDQSSSEVTALLGLVSRLDLLDFDQASANLALALSIEYGIRAIDAAHLATAIAAGADYFLTNNRKDFPKSIVEIDVIYPQNLLDHEDLAEH